MKIYKLDVDVAQPIRQVVQMQQNTTGALLVRASKDEHTLRNATIKLYDGETEIEPYATEGDYATFKIAMGQDTKNLKLKVSAAPLTSTETYLINAGTGRTKQTFCDAIQISAGTYQQDEFLPLVEQFGYKGSIVPGVTVLVPATFFTKPADAGKANFDRISIISWNPIQQLFFGMNGEWLSPDEPLVVTEDVVFGHNVTHNQTGVEFGTREYPSIGFYADYNQEIVVSPNSFAHFYAEQDLPDEEPVDSSDSELDSTDTELDSTDSELDSTDSELTDGLVG